MLRGADPVERAETSRDSDTRTRECGHSDGDPEHTSPGAPAMNAKKTRRGLSPPRHCSSRRRRSCGGSHRRAQGSRPGTRGEVVGRRSSWSLLNRLQSVYLYLAGSAEWFRMCSRARLSRDFTVPAGSESATAISVSLSSRPGVKKRISRSSGAVRRPPPPRGSLCLNVESFHGRFVLGKHRIDHAASVCPEHPALLAPLVSHEVGGDPVEPGFHRA